METERSGALPPWERYAGGGPGAYNTTPRNMYIKHQSTSQTYHQSPVVREHERVATLKRRLNNPGVVHEASRGQNTLAAMNHISTSMSDLQYNGYRPQQNLTMTSLQSISMSNLHHGTPSQSPMVSPSSGYGSVTGLATLPRNHQAPYNSMSALATLPRNRPPYPQRQGSTTTLNSIGVMTLDRRNISASRRQRLMCNGTLPAGQADDAPPADIWKKKSKLDDLRAFWKRFKKRCNPLMKTRWLLWYFLSDSVYILTEAKIYEDLMDSIYPINGKDNIISLIITRPAMDVWAAVHCLQSAVYSQLFYGPLFMVHCLWSVVYGQLFMVYCLWFVFLWPYALHLTCWCPIDGNYRPQTWVIGIVIFDRPRQVATTDYLTIWQPSRTLVSD